MRRDFIPEGEPLTPAEKARAERAIPRDANFVRPNFIPETPSKPGATRDEKAAAAAVAARQKAGKSADRELEVAKLKLKRMRATEAAQYVDELPERLKPVYAEAELDGAARVTVLRVLEKYLPADPEGPE